MSLSAAVTDLEFDVVDGVWGEDVDDKALPSGYSKYGVAGGIGSTGAWRAEMNAMRYIVNEGLTTALIFEDDIDWDVRLKKMMVEFARGSRFILSNVTEPQQVESFEAGKMKYQGLDSMKSPYGEDWDVLWLGHCGSHQVLEDRRRYVLSNDATVPSTYYGYYEEDPDTKNYEDLNTRFVYRNAQTTCSWAYAVSQHGARKILQALGQEPFNQPFDLGLGSMCNESNPGLNGFRDDDVNTPWADQRTGDGEGLKCVSVRPTIFGSWKAAGNKASDSDINMKNSGFREKPESLDIVRSVRMNMRKILEGKELEDQWKSNWVADGELGRRYEF
jgi:hypothetical protein